MPSFVLVVCVLSLMTSVVVRCHPVSPRNVLIRTEEDIENKLEGRSPPVSFAMESLLQYVLRTDQQKCLLKLVCTIGGNVTRFGSFGDRMSSYFGYTYNPVDFSVSENAHILRKLGRPANPLSGEANATVAPAVPISGSVLDDGINNATDPELFNRKSSDPRPEEVLEGRSFFPAIKVFNSAFVLGLAGGKASCERTFDACSMDLDALIRMGLNMFNNANKSNPLKTLSR